MMLKTSKNVKNYLLSRLSVADFYSPHSDTCHSHDAHADTGGWGVNSGLG